MQDREMGEVSDIDTGTFQVAGKFALETGKDLWGAQKGLFKGE